MALMMIAQTLPMILFLLLGGVVADRFPCKQVMLLSDASRAIAVRQVQSFGKRQNEAFEEQRKDKHMIRSEISQLEPLEVALTAFQKQYPTFDTTRVLDELRATEYARLDRQQHVYLDYTGGGLYAECQLCDYFYLINDKVFGNPH